MPASTREQAGFPCRFPGTGFTPWLSSSCHTGFQAALRRRLLFVCVSAPGVCEGACPRATAYVFQRLGGAFACTGIGFGRGCFGFRLCGIRPRAAFAFGKCAYASGLTRSFQGFGRTLAAGLFVFSLVFSHHPGNRFGRLTFTLQTLLFGHLAGLFRLFGTLFGLFCALGRFGLCLCEAFAFFLFTLTGFGFAPAFLCLAYLLRFKTRAGLLQVGTHLFACLADALAHVGQIGRGDFFRPDRQRSSRQHDKHTREYGTCNPVIHRCPLPFFE